jgi:hypothetical protein
MNKKLSSVFILIFLALFFLGTKKSHASSCSNYGGSTTYCDDGTSYSNYGGSTTYGSDGTSYSNYGGATTYGSDGSSQTNYGGATTYKNDGTSYSNYGGATTYGSDGSSYSNYGGATTYGSGSGKMIDVGGSKIITDDPSRDTPTYGINDDNTIDKGNGCPLNSSYNSFTRKCECLSGYKASGSSCVYDYSLKEAPTETIPTYLPSQQQDMPEANTALPLTDSEKINNPDSIQNLDTNSNNAPLSQDTPTTTQQVQNAAKKIVWWNPLTWWEYFHDKPATPAAIEEKPKAASPDGQLYKNDDYGFSIKFPTDWPIVDKSNTNSFSKSAEKSFMDSVYVKVGYHLGIPAFDENFFGEDKNVSASLDLNDLANKNAKLFINKMVADFSKQFPDIPVVEKGVTFIGNKRAAYYKTLSSVRKLDNTMGGLGQSSYYVINKGNLYTIGGSYENGDNASSTKAIVDKSIASFSFEN